ncbi:MAG: pyridine nucleotide-disulfide oxidoreductase, partial [Alphaproteobacteria bacterium]|nr:pyridine nucleotide-disulfide oxidoreductase [Alphaproteobacteria bacterium]
AFCYAGDRLLGIESINNPAEHAFARRVLAARRSIAPEQAADRGFDLRAAAATRH